MTANLLIVTSCTSIGRVPQTKTLLLDQTILEMAEEIENYVQAGQKIAVLNFNSPTERFSYHVIEELMKQLTRGRKLVVLTRSEIDIIWQEHQIQMSGIVSDEEFISIGNKYGAQLVVSGSLASLANRYRLRIRVLNVETGQVEAYPTADIDPKEDIVVHLLSGARPNPPNGLTAAQNLVFGLGSFKQGDKIGGTITAVIEGIGVAAVAASPFLVFSKQETNPWTGLTYKRERSYTTPVLCAGLAAYTAGAVYGVIRANSFQQSGSTVDKSGSTSLNAGFIPDTHGSIAMLLSYTLRF